MTDIASALERAKQALELDAKATRGDWPASKFVDAPATDKSPALKRFKFRGIQSAPLGSFSEDDAAFVAASRTLLPLLARDVEELAQALEAERRKTAELETMLAASDGVIANIHNGEVDDMQQHAEAIARHQTRAAKAEHK